MLRFPWLLPLGMVAFNILYFLYGLLVEYRIKINTVKFAVWYAATIPSAIEGDLHPFLVVVTRCPD